MADEKQEKVISVEEAIRLNHSLGQSITWGNSNLNALEVEKLTTLQVSDYQRIRKEYADWQKHRTIVPMAVWIAVTAVSLIVLYFAPQRGWLAGVSSTLALWGAYTVVTRQAHASGYVDGYDSGYESGIHKSLGINGEDVSEMADMATQMQIDDMLVKRMNERNKTAG